MTRCGLKYEFLLIGIARVFFGPIERKVRISEQSPGMVTCKTGEQV